MLDTSLKKNNSESFAFSVLNYPLDSTLILRKKKSIKKELLVNKKLIPKKIALLGGSTTSEVKEILELFLLKIGIKPEFYESKFNGFYEEAVFENKQLLAFQPDIIYLHTSHKNISVYPNHADSIKKIDELLDLEKKRYKLIWSSLLKYQCPIIQNNFDYPNHRILGNLDCTDPHGQLNYINCLNHFFSKEAQLQSHLHLHDINYLAASLGLDRWFDKQLWHFARYALSYEAIPHLAQSLAALIGSLLGLAKKCLVLDLDNTCWGGTIGDDGLEGILLGTESAVAEVYSDFQHYLKLLKERGIVLAVCSKNNLEQAKSGFRHPDSVLKEDDFVAFEANWDPKYKNLEKISNALNLPLDSMVFIDDNPAERKLVNDVFPEINVPNVGSDVLHFIDYIDKNYYFETAGLSIEDLQRNTFYKRKNIESKLKHLDYFEYLNSLNMNAEIKPFEPMYWQRITQLINKTHQFNLTNKECNLSEIEAVSYDSNYLNLYGRLSDLYGSHGLISVLITKLVNTQCYIDVWVMSCRVFGRTMEYAMFDMLVQRCSALGISELIGFYYPTAKNQIVAELYKNFGFSLIENKTGYSVWQLKLADYKKLDYSISIL